MQTIHSATDVAIALGVTNAAVSAWARERKDTPPATYRTRTGSGWRYFWDDKGLSRWADWLAVRKASDPHWRDNR